MGSRRTQQRPEGRFEACPPASATAFCAPCPEMCMHPVIRIVLARVGERFSEQWTLKRAASLVAYNPSYVCSLFHRETGVSFHEWLEARRIERSEQLLVETRKLICDIAVEVGYSDSTFGRAFKRRIGVSPQAFRSGFRRMGERLRAAAVNGSRVEVLPEAAAGRR